MDYTSQSGSTLNIYRPVISVGMSESSGDAEPGGVNDLLYHRRNSQNSQKTVPTTRAGKHTPTGVTRRETISRVGIWLTVRRLIYLTAGILSQSGRES